MTTVSRWPRWLRLVLAGAVLVIAGLPLWTLNAYVRAVEMDHSLLWSSASIADARGRGVLAGLPEIGDSTFVHGGRRLRVREAWVEEVTQVRYFWNLPGTRRVVGTGTYRIMADLVNADESPLPSVDRYYLGRLLCATSGNDTVSMFGSFGDKGPFSREIGADVPRRLTFHSGPPVCPAWELGEDL